MGTTGSTTPTPLTPASLADALFTPVQQRVLGWLFGQPERRFQSGELIRLAKSGTGAVHRLLTKLAQTGLVTVAHVGNQKHYQANPASPVFAELAGLIRKSVGLAFPLQQALAPLADKISLAFVYGSVARGEEHAVSDMHEHRHQREGPRIADRPAHDRHRRSGRPAQRDAEPPAPYGGTGYFAGSPKDYDRAHALDVAQLFAFLRATQPEAFKKLAMADANDTKDINRLKFLARLSAELGKRGVHRRAAQGHRPPPGRPLRSVLRHAVEGNAKAAALHAKNRFSITRQLAYSMDETRRALDLGLFINGLPIATFELKNSLTKQTVEDAVEQYRRDRDPRERLFEFGRCVVHFAVDDSEVRMCTELAGKASWFLPFNKGLQRRRRQPAQPDGLKTDYLWKEMLTPAGLTDILENYAQIVEVKAPEDRQEEAHAGLPALPPAGRGAAGAGRCARARRGPALPDPALGGQRQVQLHRLAGAPAHRREARRGKASSTRSSSSPTGASSTTRSRRPSSSSCRWARPWATPSTPATCAASSSRARRSSSPRCRSSRSCSTRSAPRATRPSPSSSTRRIRARAARPRPR
jgi:hypothetical protein